MNPIDRFKNLFITYKQFNCFDFEKDKIVYFAVPKNWLQKKKNKYHYKLLNMDIYEMAKEDRVCIMLQEGDKENV